jgi:Copper type II ascorbate-dependent monooxygenase, C-terminal domain
MTSYKKKIIPVLFLLLSLTTQGQKPVNFDRIQPIIQNNCVSCHRPGGMGPFSLLTYEDVSSRGKFISHVTSTKYMPPWKADPTFQSYKNERQLKPEEIQLIQEWVSSGMKKGKKKKQSVASSGEPQILKPDLTLSMTKTFAIPDQGVEEFRFFSIPTNLATDIHLAGVDFVPGNKKQVHHSRIMVDSTQRIRGIDGLSELDPKIKEFQKIPLADEFLYGWVPGNEGIFFPAGTGKRIGKGSDLILNIHYSPTSKKQEDQSKINLYFTKSPVEREVKTLTLRENDISNQPFLIPANSLKTFYISYTIEEDISLISIMPHMHFLGKSFQALAATPDGNAIPLIKIDSWDFNWQSTYVFNNLLKIPAGSIIIMQATYDNTDRNPANPNHPAKDVGYGWNSTDEMCNLVIYYVDYKEGDEKIEN